MGFKDVLKTAFPFISIAASVGGPLGTMAASAVGKALGITNVEGTTDGITTALNTALTTNPEALLELQKAEDAFKLQMAQMGIDSVAKMLELDNADRADARARQIAVRDRTPSYLAGFVTAGFFGMLAILAFCNVQPTAHDILIGMTATLGSAWLSIVAYFFGSSSGSAQKNAVIGSIITKSQDPS